MVKAALGFVVRPVGVLLAGAIYSVLVRYFDTRWTFLPYTIATTGSMAALFFLLTRRYVFSLYAAGTIIMLATLVSLLKFRHNGLALHVYDFVFTGTDWSLFGFLLSNYTVIIVSALLIGGAAIAFLAALYRFERPQRLPLSIRLAGIGVFVGAAYIAHPARNSQEAEFLPYVAGYNASALPLSLWNLPDLFGRLPLAEQIDLVHIEAPFRDAVDCGPERKKPDVFLVLAESQVPPTAFPELGMSPQLAASFRSGDGVIKPFFAETLGAGTWMTNFSVLTGLSTADFTWQGAYVTQLLENKIKGALPDVLSRCGYRTVAVIPLKYHALNEGPFLKSTGFQEVYDSDRTGLEPMKVRDRAYYAFIEDLIARHRKEDGRPLFINLQTMFSHAPYEEVLLPETGDPVVGRSSDPETNEYMRRLGIARRDLEGFRAWLTEEPGPRGSVLAEFGDHQSVATRELVLARRPDRAILADLRSAIYETYYAIRGYGAEVDYSLLEQAEDAPFLPARLVAAARLPTSPVFEDLVGLSDACLGRFHVCADRALVDRHLKRRIAAGMLEVE
ncbi:sulfatase-like hydrolase/transferase [Ciceribacter azotifigens]|uniref:sulfatase-like hydrolase/transferase n=1 Tax=Ciceribacter azotifigens TaxID=2069303 RepID=UPI003A8717FC